MVVLIYVLVCVCVPCLLLAVSGYLRMSIKQKACQSSADELIMARKQIRLEVAGSSFRFLGSFYWLWFV